MISERPYEITHVAPHLETTLRAHLPPGKTGNAEERRRNFLSRALAAFALHKLTGCELAEAAASVVDGGGDGGIDAVHYSRNTNTLWIVQSKYIDEGTGEPNLGEVSKFKNGIEDLLQHRFVAFEKNEAWTRRLPEITVALNAPEVRVRAVLIYSGIHAVSEDRRRMFEDVKERFADHDDFFAFVPVNLTTIDGWLTDSPERRAITEVVLEVLNPGWTKEPYQTIYGQVRIRDIVALHQQYGDRLIVANIRRYRGSTEVNGSIVQTVQSEPENFFYLNNGLTAYCDRFDVLTQHRANASIKRITARGFSIINGAQTLGSLSAGCNNNPNQAPSNGMVFIKIISLQGHEDERAFARRITKSTNFQNRIGPRDFVALDGEQERIAAQLRLDGIYYHYKEGDTPPPCDDQNFTVDEATTALACLEQESTCDLCGRALGDQESLWSLDEVYPDSEHYKSRYDRLFRPGRSARTVWRAVQTLRTVAKRMQELGASGTPSSDTEFFKNARCLVLNIVFLKLRTEQGQAITLTPTDLALISDKTSEVARLLWSACLSNGTVTVKASASGPSTVEVPISFNIVFYNPDSCKSLRGKVLELLANTTGMRRKDPVAPLPPAPVTEGKAS